MLLVGLAFLLPLLSVPQWIDASELPKVLLGLGIFGIWGVLRVLYATLGQAEGQPMIASARLARWLVTLAIMGFVVSLLSGHWLISLFGNIVQLSTGWVTIGLGCWLVFAVRDAELQSVGMSRRVSGAWLTGWSLSVIGYAVTRWFGWSQGLAGLFQIVNPFDTLAFAPVAVLVSGALLASRKTVLEAPSRWQIFRYRAAHAVMSLMFVASLLFALCLDLGIVWRVVFAAAGLIASVLAYQQKTRRVTLAMFVSGVAMLLAIVGIVRPFVPQVVFSWMGPVRQHLSLDTLTEVLPNQSLTWHVVGAALEKSPLFGTGPGDWLFTFDRYRPAALNQTALWNVRFPRSGSAVATGLVEYGLVFALIVLCFVCVVGWQLVKRYQRSRDLRCVWNGAILITIVVLAFLRPWTVAEMLSTALLVGCAVGISWQEQETTSLEEKRLVARPTWIGATAIVAVLIFVLVLQRAASAELLTQPDTARAQLALLLNQADDFTLQRIANEQFAQAQVQLNQGQVQTAQTTLQQAQDAVKQAIARNPADAAHWYLSLQIANTQSQFKQSAEEEVIADAHELDLRRTADPAAPLALFGVYRARALRAAQLLAQATTPDKDTVQQTEQEARQAAESALAEALRRKSDYLPALYAKAAWLAQAGQLKDAITILQTLAAQNPGAPEIALPLAALYREEHQPGLALVVLGKLIQQAPAQLSYQYEFALTAAQSEDWALATKVLQHLVAVDPKNPDYSARLQDVLHKRATLAVPAASASDLTSATSTPTLPAATSTPAISKHKRRTNRTSAL